MRDAPRVLVMGVSGSGKSTVGRALAEALGVVFLEADDFHPPANIAKMRAGLPLDDDDRMPWLQALADAMRAQAGGFVLACSALKRKYRDVLRAACPQLRIVWLDGDRETLATRMAGREGHYMPETLLDSQLETLEPPADALRVDIREPVESLVAQLVERLAP